MQRTGRFAKVLRGGGGNFALGARQLFRRVLDFSSPRPPLLEDVRRLMISRKTRETFLLSAVRKKEKGRKGFCWTVIDLVAEY